MALVIEYSYTCDGGCGHKSPVASNIGEARQLAKALGWMWIQLTYSTAGYCPSCLESQGGGVVGK